MIKKCLFPAAGYGTRFLPATKAIPKEMLPILTKPLLQYGVEEALAAGMDTMAIVSGRGKRSIEDHFDNSFELESQLIGTAEEHYLDDIKSVIERSTFTYVRQRKMLGLGHAILTGEPLIGNEAFAVILADDLCDCGVNGVTSEMIEIYKKYQCTVIAVEEIPFTQVERYGVISGDLIDGTNDTYRVTNMFEKPNLPDLMYRLLSFGLRSFGLRVENIFCFVYPAALMTCLRIYFIHGSPKPHGSITNSQLGNFHTTAFEFQQYLSPTLSGLSYTIFDG